ncbi:methyl-accepting chemotaxis protein [Salinigranum halophilum]|uniref:methyl-accepting chemotaxis protein n=1 Tax=Salinigranum halophilum TaxID=2565931 RepID=UPI001F0029D9|nr:methyl-accepting chemotaxis protein [Salinigranum halophilum]
MATSTPDSWIRSLGLQELQRTVGDVIRYVPRGESLPEETWEKRHRNILVLLLAHVPFLFALGTFTGTDPYLTGADFVAVPLEHAVVGVGVLTAIAGVAWWSGLPRRVRASVSAVGLMTSSALLVYFSGGFIEAHFHFFVVAGVIATYEDWLPFAVSILFVAAEHSLFGMTNPEAVYNHPDAVANPMGWGLVHAIFLLGLCAALVSNWFSIERSREETRQQRQNVRDSEEAKAEVEQLNERLLVQADELAAAMDAVSEGDFTATPPENADIEAIAAISDAFTEMKRELSATIVDLREFATTVERTTRSVHDDAETLERAQQQLASDVRAFATDVRTQASNLESTTGELSTLSATIEEIAANADEVSTEAGNAADAASAGTDTAAAAVEAIEHIERSVGELAALVDSLDTRMDEVAESTDLIESIAQQTNTLALNANIEAARAVNDSEGFAVVADEVKSLADETQDHSAAISLTIGETIEDVKRVQREMSQTKSQIETGKETTADAGEAFTDLTATVDGVDASVTEVATATDDGARTTEEVVDAITRVADQARTVAEQSESLADRADTRATTISEIRSQLDDLTGQTGTLQRQLDTFTCEPTGRN